MCVPNPTTGGAVAPNVGWRFVDVVLEARLVDCLMAGA
jgi:hypothetical protein